MRSVGPNMCSHNVTAPRLAPQCVRGNVLGIASYSDLPLDRGEHPGSKGPHQSRHSKPVSPGLLGSRTVLQDRARSRAARSALRSQRLSAQSRRPAADLLALLGYEVCPRLQPRAPPRSSAPGGPQACLANRPQKGGRELGTEPLAQASGPCSGHDPALPAARLSQPRQCPSAGLGSCPKGRAPLAKHHAGRGVQLGSPRPGAHPEAPLSTRSAFQRRTDPAGFLRVALPPL